MPPKRRKKIGKTNARVSRTEPRRTRRVVNLMQENSFELNSDFNHLLEEYYAAKNNINGSLYAKVDKVDDKDDIGDAGSAEPIIRFNEDGDIVILEIDSFIENEIEIRNFLNEHKISYLEKKELTLLYNGRRYSGEIYYDYNNRGYNIDFRDKGIRLEELESLERNIAIENQSQKDEVNNKHDSKESKASESPYFMHGFYKDKDGKESLFIWEVGGTKTYKDFSSAENYISKKLALKPGDAEYDIRFEEFRRRPEKADKIKYPKYGFPTYWFKKTPGWDKPEKQIDDTVADPLDVAEFDTTEYNKRGTGFYINARSFDNSVKPENQTNKGNAEFIGEYVDSRPAIVKAPDGIILHDTPTTNDTTYTQIKQSSFSSDFTIPKGGKVEIIARGNKDNPDWVLIRSGNTVGWIQERLLGKDETKTDPLKIFGESYRVKAGDGLEKIFKEKLPAGINRKDYAVAFLYLNKEKEDWYFNTKNDYTISDFTKDLLDPANVDQNYVYPRVELVEGALVKIPNKKFVDELKASGVLDQRTDADQSLVDLVKAAVPFIEGMYDGFVKAGKDAAQEIWDTLKSVISGELLEQIKQLYEFFKTATYAQLKDILTSSAKDFEEKWNSDNAEEKWHYRGEVAGQILFEVVMSTLTGGGGVLSKLKNIKALEKTIIKLEKTIDSIKGSIPNIDSVKKKLGNLKSQNSEKKLEAFVPLKNKDETIKEAFEREKKEFLADFDKEKLTKEFKQKVKNAFSKYKGSLSEEEYMDRYKTLYKNRKIGKIGEDVFQKFKGGKSETFSFDMEIDGKTKKVKRIIDNFADEVAREIKTGYLKDTKFIKEQILKDIKIKQLNKNVKIEWHLFNGGDPELIEFMRKQGIKVVTY